MIITLILLSVTLLMALAFLAISNRERTAVSTSTDIATARLAADAGLAAAEAQIAANILAGGSNVLAEPVPNPYNFGLLVSTNYVPLATGNLLQDLNNMQFSPRAPVWLTNLVTHTMENRYYLDLNRDGVPETNGWVVSVDNNGNFLGNAFEVGDPEWIGVLERPDQPHGPNNHFIARFAFIALPAGNELDVNSIHNQTMDTVNVNRALNPPPVGVGDVYFRNQGVGSWELNLAAFLADLNTNQWNNNLSGNNYLYKQAIPPPFSPSPNTGAAFDDARAMLAYRYGNSYASLAPAAALLNGAPGFDNDNIDGYSDGPLQTNTAAINESFHRDLTNFPWAGADNTNRFFTPDDLFDSTKIQNPFAPSAGFTDRLLSAGTNNLGGVNVSTYDRYTFYRMLAQLGTDSTPESGQMNLNYDNLDPYTNSFGVINPPSATNFMAWTPLGFFTNAADRLLRAYTAQWVTNYVLTNPVTLVVGFYLTNNPSFVATFNVTNYFGLTPTPGVLGIPVLVSNQFVYTPAVQRLLQVAANLYDASTNSHYPSVFRPLFSTTNRTGGYVDVFITGYALVGPTNVAPADDSRLSPPIEAANVLGYNVATNVYGVPWIIGAKKGFPNFNAFTFENVFQITRKLQLSRTSTNVYYWQDPTKYTLEQQVSLDLTNVLGVECWNSYAANYTNPISIFASVTNIVVLTNDAFPFGLKYYIPSFNNGAISNSFWPGYGAGTIPQSTSFQIPLSQFLPILQDQVYTFNTLTPFVSAAQANFYTTMATPHWGLLITNRLRVVMVEQDAGGINHIIDYAQFLGPDSSHDLMGDIQASYDTYNPAVKTTYAGYDDQWDTNLAVSAGSVPAGMANQIAVSGQLDSIVLSPYWGNQDPSGVTNQTAGFRAFLGFSALPGMPPSAAQYIAVGATSFAQQAPYTPTATVAYQTQWEANDPLVHYLASDLIDLAKNPGASKQVIPLNFGQLNDRYKPWGGNPQFAGNDYTPYNSAVKDPMAPLPGLPGARSDNWDFPTNKFPTVGWMGRVHRGTPWQTVYLKSADVPNANVSVPIGTNYVNISIWQYLNGNPNYFDASNSVPVQDRLLFDLFTTSFNENASRGTLSVNQGAGSTDPAAGLAAWSAVFSGLVVPTTLTNTYKVIAPVGVFDSGQPLTNQPPLAQIVAGINGARTNMISADGLVGVFEHKGDILSAPQLTERSPYLAGLNFTNQISDELYEWLPQQVMSLVRAGAPRYVIYSYGQALKPAASGVYLQTTPALLSGQSPFGTVTNYQVVSSIATRAVLRIEGAPTNTHAVLESFNILPPE